MNYRDSGPAGPFIEEEQAEAEVEETMPDTSGDDLDETGLEEDEEEVTVGGELNHTEEPAPNPEAKTHAIFNEDYTVTPEAGYRK
jgi:hypothetical protein